MLWTLVLKIPNGHRYFRAGTAEDGRIAVADNSGRTPDKTDDGILWLDMDRAIHLSSMTSGSIPVKSENELRPGSYTGEYVKDCLVVARTFGMKVEFDGDMKDFVAEYDAWKAQMLAGGAS